MVGEKLGFNFLLTYTQLPQDEQERDGWRETETEAIHSLRMYKVLSPETEGTEHSFKMYKGLSQETACQGILGFPVWLSSSQDKQGHH